MKESRLELAIELLHGADEAALATQSATVPGYPFASLVPFVTDERQRPVMLLSSLAEHSRNLAADPRASLMIARNLGGGEIARLTLVGEIRRIEADAHLVARYLRYHPAAQRFLQLGDFAFQRMDVQRVMTVGGFARASWLEADRLLDAAQLPPEMEARWVTDFNRDADGGALLIGLDPWGADFREADGNRGRSRFADAPLREDDAAEVLRPTEI